MSIPAYKTEFSNVRIKKSVEVQNHQRGHVAPRVRNGTAEPVIVDVTTKVKRKLYIMRRRIAIEDSIQYR